MRYSGGGGKRRVREGGGVQWLPSQPLKGGRAGPEELGESKEGGGRRLESWSCRRLRYAFAGSAAKNGIPGVDRVHSNIPRRLPPPEDPPVSEP